LGGLSSVLNIAVQADLHCKGIVFQTFKVDFRDVDRAVLDSVDGFVKILTADKKDTILGATIVGPDAGNSRSILNAIGVHCPSAFQQPLHPVTFSVLTAGRQQGHHTKSHYGGHDARKPYQSITQCEMRLSCECSAADISHYLPTLACPGFPLSVARGT